jgi:cystathionine beta-lyase family protein involved in aluminum resistance
MEEVGTSETSSDLYKTTWCNIPEESHLRTQFISGTWAYSVALFAYFNELKTEYNTNILHDVFEHRLKFVNKPNVFSLS